MNTIYISSYFYSIENWSCRNYIRILFLSLDKMIKREERWIQTPDTHFSTDSPHWLPLTGESSGPTCGFMRGAVRVCRLRIIRAWVHVVYRHARIRRAHGCVPTSPRRFPYRIYPRYFPNTAQTSDVFSKRSLGSNAFFPFDKSKKIARSFRESELLLRRSKYAVCISHNGIIQRKECCEK